MTRFDQDSESAPRPTPRRLAREQRALLAWEFVVARRLTLAEAAAALGISLSTLQRDLGRVRERLREALAQQQAAERGTLDAAVELLGEVDAAARAAWRDYAATRADSPARPRLLRLALEAAGRKQRVLESVGLLRDQALEARLAALEIAAGLRAPVEGGNHEAASQSDEAGGD